VGSSESAAKSRQIRNIPVKRDFLVMVVLSNNAISILTILHYKEVCVETGDSKNKRV
jgi:hypothetical protein